jgi:hypothetical protein
MNMYAYVGGDPVNSVDPTGLQQEEGEHIEVTGKKKKVRRREGGPGSGAPDGGSPGPGQELPNSDADGDGLPDENILITAIRTLKQRKLALPRFMTRLGRCFGSQMGLGELAEAAAVAAGQPIPGTKRFVTPGSSRGTSLAGMAADKMFGKARLPVRLPTIVGGPGTGRALAVAGTKSVARFAGRAVPIVGWALLAYDAGSIAVCTARDD